MNIIDVVIVLLIILSFINGYKRGVLKEVVMLCGTIVIYIVSFLLKDKLGLILCKILPFFNLDGLVSLNILIYQLIAFFLIASFLFSIFGIVLKFTGVLQKLVNMTIILTIPSKILGGILGLVEGYIVIFALLIILSVPFKNIDIFKNSNLNNKIITSSPILSSTLGNLDDLIIDIYDIKIDKDQDKDKMNDKILDMYIDYNVISREDLDSIIKSGKLDKAKNKSFATKS